MRRSTLLVCTFCILGPGVINCEDFLVGTRFNVSVYHHEKRFSLWYHSGVQSGLSLLMNTSGWVSSLDYHFSKNLLFVVTSNGLLRKTLSRESGSKADAVANKTEFTNCRALAVDWVHDRLYTLNRIPNGYSIVASGLNGEDQRTVHSWVESATNYFMKMKIDPYKGILFWLPNDTVQSIKTSGKMLNPNNVTNRIRDFTIDMTRRRIYCVKALDHPPALYSINYTGGDEVKLFSIPHLEGVLGLNILGNKLFWINKSRNSDVLYQALLNLTGPDDVKTIATLNQVYEMKLLDSSVQNLSKRDPCLDQHCAYTCVATGEFVAECKCPRGQALQQDGESCHVINGEYFLLGTSRNVTLYHAGVQNGYTVLMYTYGWVVVVDYHFSKNLLFVLTSNGLFKQTLSRESGSKVDAVATRIEITHCSALTVDWVHDHIYSINRNSTAYSIVVSNLNGEDQETVLSWLEPPTFDFTKMMIDPYKGTLFWLASDTIQSIETSDGNFKPNVANPTYKVTDFTLDMFRRRIYYLRELDDTYVLYSVDYNMGGGRKLHNFPQLPNAGGLSFLGEKLFWKSKRDNSTILYKAPLNLTGPDDVKTIAMLNKSVSAMKLLDSSLQKRPELDPCFEKGCAHSCVATGEFTAECKCPPGQALHHDGLSCHGIRIYPDTPLDNQQMEDPCLDKGCNHSCVATGEFTAECECPPGQTLHHDGTSCHVPPEISGDFLLGTQEGVTLYHAGVRNSYTMLINDSGWVFLVDYHFSKNLLFVLTNNGLFKKTLALESGSKTDDIATKLDFDNCSALAVDWVHDRLYTLDQISDGYAIVVSGLSGEDQRTVLSWEESGPFLFMKMEIDPLNGLLFWRARRWIQSIKTSSEISISNVTNPMYMVQDFALDITRRRIYYTRGSDDTGTLYSINYAGDEEIKIDNVPQFCNVQGLSILGDKLFWDSKINGLDVLYEAPINLTGPDDVKKFVKVDVNVNDMKLLDFSLQKQPKRDPCLDKGCAHSCVATGETMAECKCPPGQTLCRDGVSCYNSHSNSSSPVVAPHGHPTRIPCLATPRQTLHNDGVSCQAIEGESVIAEAILVSILLVLAALLAFFLRRKAVKKTRFYSISTMDTNCISYTREYSGSQVPRASANKMDDVRL